MAIYIDEQKKLFTLSTKNTSYQMMADKYLVLNHLYYGENIGQEDMSYLLDYQDRGFSGNPYEAENERDYSLDSRPQEYSTNGVGDYRINSVSVINADGSDAADWRYAGYTIEKGKYAIPGMPALYGEEKDADTLIVELADKVTRLHAFLYYSVWEERDIITRCVKFVNQGTDAIVLTKAASMNLDLMSGDWELMHFHGRHNLERQMERVPLMRGKMTVESVRGASSHQHNPFAILCSKDTTEEAGPCYGTALVYSGNFSIEAEKDQMGQTRLTAGINSQRFAWTLEAGAEFWTPEAVMTYSSEGFGKMSSNFHHTFREHLCRGKYKHERRPVLINNWEATYFDFDTDKLLDIAREAKKDGIEMLVMDDGWFGKRNKDDSSLGDWVVNEEKIKGGLKNLVDKVNEIGLEFGIWFEPEMISPDSDLYREHPEWAIQIPGREATEIRCQYVLDLSRPEVQDYAYECVAKILRSANIKYVKWDMNRQLSDLGSTYLDKDSQQELFHRYVLGMYAMQERLVQEFPDLLLENCSGGGARFDPGMLYYSPQIWCSDDTDAIERLEIQEGTALIYPLCSMGAHVSVCPNHTVGRVTPFTTRGHVALAGTFGYELDITKLPEEERKLIPEQTAMYHKYHELIREGEYYRILSCRENHRSDCWAVASEDKSEVLVTYVQVLAQANMPSRKVRLRGFDPAKKYRLEGTDEVYSGEMLMNAGFRMKDFWGDFVSRLYHFVAVD